VTLLNARAIGVMTMRDGGKLDRKILAVNVDDRQYDVYRQAAGLPAPQLAMLRRFFQEYKKLEGKSAVVNRNSADGRSPAGARQEAVVIAGKGMTAHDLPMTPYSFLPHPELPDFAVLSASRIQPVVRIHSSRDRSKDRRLARSQWTAATANPAVMPAPITAAMMNAALR
jgi:hypothetical protein